MRLLAPASNYMKPQGFSRIHLPSDGPLAEARTEAGRHVVDITYKYFSCYKLNDDSVIYLTEDA